VGGFAIALPDTTPQHAQCPHLHNVRCTSLFLIATPAPVSAPAPASTPASSPRHSTLTFNTNGTPLAMQVQNLIKHLYHRYPRCRVCVLVNRWERQYVLLSLGVHWTHLLHQPPTTSPYTPNVTCAPAVNTPRTMGHLGPGHHGIVGHVNAGAKSIRIASRCNIPL
jgi:hypothetical protein